MLWTPKIRLVTVLLSIVFVLGTALQNHVIIDLDLIERSMRLKGAPTEDAPAYLSALRSVGNVFILGNALGLLVWFRRRWLFWPVLAVNVGQACGVFVVPFEVHRAAFEEYGWPGVLPSVVTDGGAVFLSIALIVAYVRSRWFTRTGDPIRF
ncbi:hypothetical protein [Amycolatopsis regifaucium]|uniref:Uncharacterized protein n=1 Tax=Amycolatopsis regifaucium TaxID=546365 RepID=A0A154MUC8_9PSEU|nr:hypothetical protein [Amycolatopsis regifaucium]KZB87347.1 hypothetical protein AVL48_22105 [Amycolatopsis regifaucium]OKA08181.1 hypothetical protein ATP06_0212865 [Amycolatopsis regifaucium]SFI42539.1 hypothetical protein SAMN04489731_110237 [Amycolatopsis regifaucium]